MHPAPPGHSDKVATTAEYVRSVIARLHEIDLGETPPAARFTTGIDPFEDGHGHR